MDARIKAALDDLSVVSSWAWFYSVSTISRIKKSTGHVALWLIRGQWGKVGLSSRISRDEKWMHISGHKTWPVTRDSGRQPVHHRDALLRRGPPGIHYRAFLAGTLEVMGEKRYEQKVRCLTNGLTAYRTKQAHRIKLSQNDTGSTKWAFLVSNFQVRWLIIRHDSLGRLNKLPRTTEITWIWHKGNRNQ